MKKYLLCTLLAGMAFASALAQHKGKVVYDGKDVTFYQIDERTWVGNGRLLSFESLYLVEGDDKAILIDAGTKIEDLDKIVASITKKPVTLVATHVHPDHTGSSVNYFPEIYIHRGDSASTRFFMRDYKGKIKFLEDNQVIDLGGRKLRVVHTPGHTAGSICYIDKESGYGFSGDAFGGNYLLLTADFSTLIASCKKMLAVMEEDKIPFCYQGHYSGNICETPQRLKDMIKLSEDVLSGKIKGQVNPDDQYGLPLFIKDYGVQINYRESALK